MCNALWECLKCPAKVVCCCCKCACNMLLGIICSALVLIVIIGLIVYFTVYYHKDNGTDASTESVKSLLAVTPTSFKDYFSH